MDRSECRVIRNLTAGTVILPHALKDPLQNRDWAGKTLAGDIPAGSRLDNAYLLPDSDERFIPLAEFLQEPQAIERLVELDHVTYDQHGLDFADEPWQENHFEYELPGKFELSYVALCGTRLLGYRIHSERVTGEVHGHRMAIVPEYRNGNLVRRLWCYCWRAALDRSSIRRLTGEISAGNTRMRRLLFDLGYFYLSAEETRDYLSARGRTEQIEGTVIVGSEGARSIAVARTLENTNGTQA